MKVQILLFLLTTGGLAPKIPCLGRQYCLFHHRGDEGVSPPTSRLYLYSDLSARHCSIQRLMSLYLAECHSAAPGSRKCYGGGGTKKMDSALPSSAPYHYPSGLALRSLKREDNPSLIAAPRCIQPQVWRP